MSETIMTYNNKVMSFGSTPKWMAVESDPYNPLGLPDKTIRCKFSSGYTPTMGDSQTLVDASANIWDIYKSSTSWISLFERNTQLEEVIAANTTGVTSMINMFNGCSSLTSVPLFDTSSVTGMTFMFQDCSSLMSVPLFDTSSVTDMSYMFHGCTSLTSVPLFDTSSVEYMSSMFLNCANLASVPLFDTSSVLGMTYMFSGCTNLVSVPLFDTSLVNNMSSMFLNCYAVESGALALYRQASSQANPPTYYSNCFTNCGRDTVTGAAELAQIPPSWGGLSLAANTIRCKFASGYTPTMGDSQTLVNASANIWDIYKSGKNWNSLFYNNTQIGEVIPLEEVIAANTTGVKSMRSMFYRCTKLVRVPLFDTSFVTDMDSMFFSCTSLTSVPLFDTSLVWATSYMFYNCYAVESGALALYQQASTQATPPTSHSATFSNCGRDTVTGAQELAQIPTSWGGTMS